MTSKGGAGESLRSEGLETPAGERALLIVFDSRAGGHTTGGKGTFSPESVKL